LSVVLGLVLARVRCSRGLFCFCSHRRSLVVLLLVCCLLAPVVRCSCSCSQRWSLLLGIVCALFPCVAPLVALWNQGPMNDQKSAAPTGEACVSSVSVLFRRSVLHDVAFAWSVWFLCLLDVWFENFLLSQHWHVNVLSRGRALLAALASARQHALHRRAA
jgi:hypothetical protein